MLVFSLARLITYPFPHPLTPLLFTRFDTLYVTSPQKEGASIMEYIGHIVKTATLVNKAATNSVTHTRQRDENENGARYVENGSRHFENFRDLSENSRRDFLGTPPARHKLTKV
jgi:hypothetical protein